MMAGYLHVINDTFHINRQIKSSHKRETIGDVLNQPGQARCHIAIHEAAFCTGIGDQTLLTQALDVAQRLLDK